MKKLWIVTGDDYESSVTLRAFKKKQRAEAFKRRCVDHDRKIPEAPRSADIPDDEWDKWAKANDRWRDRHPNGQGHSYDSYNVLPLAFDDAD